MTPIYLNSSSNNCSSYASDQHSEDHLCSHQFLSPNSQASSSSNSLTTHLFLNSTINHDQHGVFRSESQPPQQRHQGDNFGSQAYNNCRIESNHWKDLNFSTWKIEADMNSDHNQVKWMSSKMRVMLKMKKSDPTKPNTFSATTTQVKIEDHKLPTSSAMEETDYSSNSTSSNSNVPIRVCSDCNTTKTPLWRSGPRGPKSLCNACGIRQRKARRAMAAAAAAAVAANGNSTNVHIDQSIMAPLKLKKIQHKEHKRPSNGHVTKYKKRQYSKQTTAIISPSPSPSSSPPARKNCVEEFLVSLSKNLALYRLFPQDEKEAAILLMALSCGHAQET